MNQVNPLIPVFPQTADGVAAAAPFLPAMQALDQAQRRAAMFAQLGADPLFQAEFVDGFLKEMEDKALADVQEALIADLARARDQWVNTKDLRKRLRDEMADAPAALKRYQSGPPVP
jgi:hypothetical protein